MEVFSGDICSFFFSKRRYSILSKDGGEGGRKNTHCVTTLPQKRTHSDSSFFPSFSVHGVLLTAQTHLSARSPSWTKEEGGAGKHAAAAIDYKSCSYVVGK